MAKFGQTTSWLLAVAILACCLGSISAEVSNNDVQQAQLSAAAAAAAEQQQRPTVLKTAPGDAVHTARMQKARHGDAGSVSRAATAASAAGTATAARAAGTATAARVAGTATAARVAGTATAARVAGTATAARVAGTANLALAKGTQPAVQLAAPQLDLAEEEASLQAMFGSDLAADELSMQGSPSMQDATAANVIRHKLSSSSSSNGGSGGSSIANRLGLDSMPAWLPWKPQVSTANVGAAAAAAAPTDDLTYDEDDGAEILEEQEQQQQHVQQLQKGRGWALGRRSAKQQPQQQSQQQPEQQPQQQTGGSGVTTASSTFVQKRIKPLWTALKIRASSLGARGSRLRRAGRAGKKAGSTVEGLGRAFALRRKKTAEDNNDSDSMSDQYGDAVALSGPQVGAGDVGDGGGTAEQRLGDLLHSLQQKRAAEAAAPEQGQPAAAGALKARKAAKRQKSSITLHSGSEGAGSHGHQGKSSPAYSSIDSETKKEHKPRKTAHPSHAGSEPTTGKKFKLKKQVQQSSTLPKRVANKLGAKKVQVLQVNQAEMTEIKSLLDAISATDSGADGLSVTELEGYDVAYPLSVGIAAQPHVITDDPAAFSPGPILTTGPATTTLSGVDAAAEAQEPSAAEEPLAAEELLAAEESPAQAPALPPAPTDATRKGAQAKKAAPAPRGVVNVIHLPWPSPLPSPPAASPPATDPAAGQPVPQPGASSGASQDATAEPDATEQAAEETELVEVEEGSPAAAETEEVATGDEDVDAGIEEIFTEEGGGDDKQEVVIEEFDGSADSTSDLDGLDTEEASVEELDEGDTGEIMEEGVAEQADDSASTSPEQASKTTEDNGIEGNEATGGKEQESSKPEDKKSLQAPDKASLKSPSTPNMQPGSGKQRADKKQPNSDTEGNGNKDGAKPLPQPTGVKTKAPDTTPDFDPSRGPESSDAGVEPPADASVGGEEDDYAYLLEYEDDTDENATAVELPLDDASETELLIDGEADGLDASSEAEASDNEEATADDTYDPELDLVEGEETASEEQEEEPNAAPGGFEPDGNCADGGCALNCTAHGGIPDCLLCTSSAAGQRQQQACTYCRPGFYLETSFKCTPCPKGSWCGGLKATECSEGFTTSGPGMWSKSQCDRKC